MFNLNIQDMGSHVRISLFMKWKQIIKGFPKRHSSVFIVHIPSPLILWAHYLTVGKHSTIFLKLCVHYLSEMFLIDKLWNMRSSLGTENKNKGAMIMSNLHWHFSFSMPLKYQNVRSLKPLLQRPQKGWEKNSKAAGGGGQSDKVIKQSTKGIHTLAFSVLHFTLVSITTNFWIHLSEGGKKRTMSINYRADMN